MAAHRGQVLVDLLQDLLGLALGVRGGIARDDARQVHRVAVDDRLAQPGADAVTLDAHRALL